MIWNHRDTEGTEQVIWNPLLKIPCVLSVKSRLLSDLFRWCY
jgi:hypothetical protein